MTIGDPAGRRGRRLCLLLLIDDRGVVHRLEQP
jgi:hypothetical protein